MEVLHDIVYIVADKPSKNNLDPAIALVGTPSHKTLISWLDYAGIIRSRTKIFNQIDNPFDKEALTFLRNVKIITLGKNAMKYVMDTGIETFYHLPHPSPANRANHKNIEEQLDNCRKFVYSKI